MTASKIVTMGVHRPQEEEVEIWLYREDGTEIMVGSANHDEDGWSGVGSVEDLAENVANAFGLEIIET